MNFKTWLISEAIEDVRKTYKSLIDFLEESTDDLYVNFSEYPRFENNPYKIQIFHQDPIGIYAFPKDYVVQEQSKNEMFFGMPYITVFKLKENAKILNLSTMTEDQAKKLLEKINIKYDDEYQNIPGHIFYHSIRKYISENLHTIKNKNLIWNKLLKIAGDFDVIKDQGSGIIHSSEPEQIIVLNKNVIENVKKIENPYQTYVSSFFSNIADVAKEIGRKYFKDYYIQQFKKVIRKESPENLYKDAAFYVISKNKQLPYSISFYYRDGNLNVTLIDPYKNYTKLAEKKYETRGIQIKGYKPKGGWLDGPSILKMDFNKEELLQEIEKNIKIHLNPLEQDIEKEATDLLKEINQLLNVPKTLNVKFKNNIAYKEFDYQAGLPIKFKITINSDFKNKTYVIFEWMNLHPIYPRKSSYPINLPAAPKFLNPTDIVNQFKEKLEENMKYLSTLDVFSSLYDDKTITENLLKTFFK